jgi:hypothetical protein
LAVLTFILLPYTFYQLRTIIVGDVKLE